MYNYVQTVHVGKASGAVSTAQTVGQPLNLATVQFGDVYLLDDTGLVLDAATAATTQTAKIVRGTGNGKVISSAPLKKLKPADKYTFQAYTAPVAQVSTFANLELQPNKQYKLQVVIQEDLKTIANRQNRIETYITTGANVGVADINRLVANFNKQRQGTITSLIRATASGTTGIILTGQSIPTAGIADYEFVRFEVNFVEVTPGVIVTTSLSPSSETKAVGGQGVAVQIRQLERVSQGNFGISDRTNTWYRPTPSYGAVDGVGYDIYNVQQHLTHEGVLQDTMTSPVSTLVALVTGSAQATAIKTLLDAFLAGTATTPPTGE